MTKRRDYTVIATKHRFSVYARISKFDGLEWHWIDGWHCGTFHTEAKALAEAERLNAKSGEII